ncbi:hypothetical protein MY3296_006967 [Beauveria thailandica]
MLMLIQAYSKGCSESLRIVTGRWAATLGPSVPEPEETATDLEQSEETIDVYKSEPPDGGLAAWLALLSCWCMLFCTFGMMNYEASAHFRATINKCTSAPLVVKISPLKEAGYRIGLLFAMSSVSGLVTSPIGGAILEHWHGDYTGMKIYSGVMMLSGAALVFVCHA